jgi:class 3 adenylate cyclase/HAMP domain-containing protein
MRLRTYLVLSYLTLMIILTVGMWAIFHRSMEVLTDHSLEVAVTTADRVTGANVKESERILTGLGEYIVRDKAEDVARELTYVLAGKKSFDYRQLRRDPRIRKIAVQAIKTETGQAGYTDLYDQKGFILFHPDPRVEGSNQLDYQEQFPETTELIRRSLTEDHVSGYFNFFDRQNRERKRYSYRVHVPGTPFIVGAIVNIDEFFLPTQERIKRAGREIVGRAEERIKGHYRDIDRMVKMQGLLAGLVVSLMGFVAGLWFAGSISRPISRLRDGVRQVGSGDFAAKVPEAGFQEVVNLAQTFNLMGDQLLDYMEKRDFIRDTFGRYVTQEVVKKLLESEEALEMGGETREVSLLMSDLRGFTAIIADMHPEQVIHFLNRYLDKMIEVLLDHHAVIDEILGDGILAFFGAPEPLGDHPARAVACALAMQAAMPEINAANARDGLPHLEMGIGVNTGAVVVGNIGSERRTKYSVVGSNVNFAARMEAYALPGQVLISPSTYDRVKDLVEIRDVTKVEMKGMPEPAILYEVGGIGGPYQIRLAERRGVLVELPEKIDVLVAQLRDKIVAGTPQLACITHLCENAAAVALPEKLPEWEDVRLTLLDRDLNEIPGHVYGKVTGVKPAGSELFEAAISFTSISPEIYQILRKAMGEGSAEGTSG